MQQSKHGLYPPCLVRYQAQKKTQLKTNLNCLNRSSLWHNIPFTKHRSYECFWELVQEDMQKQTQHVHRQIVIHFLLSLFFLPSLPCVGPKFSPVQLIQAGKLSLGKNWRKSSGLLDKQNSNSALVECTTLLCLARKDKGLWKDRKAALYPRGFVFSCRNESDLFMDSLNIWIFDLNG